MLLNSLLYWRNLYMKRLALSYLLSLSAAFGQMVTLEGNTRPEATIQNDRGAVADSFPLHHLLLQLRRSPEREAALEEYITQLHDPQSASFHQWLTPEQFGAQCDNMAAVERLHRSWRSVIRHGD